MKYNLIRKMDISNGPGVRVSVFMQGCGFHCKNCFNKETWDFEAGKDFNQDTIDEVLNLADTIYVIYDGELVGKFENDNIAPEELGLYMAGGKRMDLEENKEEEGRTVLQSPPVPPWLWLCVWLYDNLLS